jgi:hypothetical protein
MHASFVWRRRIKSGYRSSEGSRCLGTSRCVGRSLESLSLALSLAPGPPPFTVTHTARLVSRSRATSSLRFSSRLAMTRSGARAAILARSGFLVPGPGSPPGRPGGCTSQWPPPAVPGLTPPPPRSARALATPPAGPGRPAPPGARDHPATPSPSHVTPVLPADLEERLLIWPSEQCLTASIRAREDVLFARRRLEAAQRGRGGLGVPG